MSIFVDLFTCLFEKYQKNITYKVFFFMFMLQSRTHNILDFFPFFLRGSGLLSEEQLVALRGAGLSAKSKLKTLAKFFKDWSIAEEQYTHAKDQWVTWSSEQAPASSQKSLLKTPKVANILNMKMKQNKNIVCKVVKRN